MPAGHAGLIARHELHLQCSAQLGTLTCSASITGVSDAPCQVKAEGSDSAAVCLHLTRSSLTSVMPAEHASLIVEHELQLQCSAQLCTPVLLKTPFDPPCKEWTDEPSVPVQLYDSPECRPQEADMLKPSSPDLPALPMLMLGLIAQLASQASTCASRAKCSSANE